MIESSIISDAPTFSQTALKQKLTPSAKEGELPSLKRTPLTLIVLHSAFEPHQVGQFLVIPPLGETITLHFAEDDCFRIRDPGENWSQFQLTDRRRIDKGVGLSIARNGKKKLRLSRMGPLEMTVNGRPVNRALVSEGDTIALGAVYLFLCVKRPEQLPGFEGDAHLWRHEYGVSDLAGIVGESPSSWRLRQSISEVGMGRGHCLIQGPRGSGKVKVGEAIAKLYLPVGTRGIHRNAVLLRTVVRTGADGKLEWAEPTIPGAPFWIFLDEVTALSQAEQVFVAQVLEDQADGLSTACPTIRFFACTSQDIDTIHPRLQRVFSHLIEIDSFAKRPEDVPLLARQLLRAMWLEEPEYHIQLESIGADTEFPRIHPDLIAALLAREWPSQIRELRFYLRRCLGNICDGWLCSAESATVLSNKAETQAGWRPGSLVRAFLARAPLSTFWANRLRIFQKVGFRLEAYGKLTGSSRDLAYIHRKKLLSDVLYFVNYSVKDSIQVIVGREPEGRGLDEKMIERLTKEPSEAERRARLKAQTVYSEFLAELNDGGCQSQEDLPHLSRLREAISQGRLIPLAVEPSI